MRRAGAKSARIEGYFACPKRRFRSRRLIKTENASPFEEVGPTERGYAKLQLTKAHAHRPKRLEAASLERRVFP
jgi:hypothetical protein